tara:strand:- start:1078 stop:1254 length:177 start_codon:yes stop_codon:yes gene_type:complete
MPIRTNPFSGESAQLTDEQAKLHDEIKTAEAKEDYDTMQKKISKFSRLNPEAYFILID